MLAMLVILQRWGNGAGVRLPAAVLRKVGIAIGDRLEISVDNSRLVLSPVRRKPRLAELLAATPKCNDRVPGWDEMPAAGRKA
jgi:antitoxin component of MazEF toxin-antitoxin module